MRQIIAGQHLYCSSLNNINIVVQKMSRRNQFKKEEVVVKEKARAGNRKPKGAKIVIIGAGSRSFGRCQITDILLHQEPHNCGLTLTLVDIDPKALELMHNLAERINRHLGAGITIESTTDRRKALLGATYVMTAVTLNRYDLWEQDYRIPRALGFNHVYGENGGPGALFHTLRNLKIIMPICADIEELCPEALLLNFTNPEARILHAISHLTKVRAIGICHGFYDAQRPICQYLKKKPEELDIISAGMNHFYCILKVIDKKTGKDLKAELFKRVLADPQAETLFKKLIEHFGVFTYPSYHHFGEYLSYGDCTDNGRWPYGKENGPVHKNPPSHPQHLPLEDYASGKLPIDQKVLAIHHEVSVPLICAIERKKPMVAEAVNVLNTNGYIENLPEHGVVEVPANVDGQGVHPITVGAIPETWATYIRTQYSIHQLTTQAHKTKRKELLVQALLLDPTCRSIQAAEQLVKDMLHFQKDYLPEFK
jgi:alpha-galactosidase